MPLVQWRSQAKQHDQELLVIAACIAVFGKSSMTKGWFQEQHALLCLVRARSCRASVHGAARQGGGENTRKGFEPWTSGFGNRHSTLAAGRPEVVISTAAWSTVWKVF